MPNSERRLDAVDGGGAPRDEALAGTVHHQLGLLLQALGRNDTHARARHRFADAWLYALNRRAQWWAPEQASMPSRQGGNDATSSRSFQRGTLGRTSTALPVASSPCRSNTFLARSIPRVTIAMDSPFERVDEISHFTRAR